jgi:hypothetical protein
LYVDPYIIILPINIRVLDSLKVCMHRITVILLYRDVLINLKYLSIKFNIDFKTTLIN